MLKSLRKKSSRLIRPVLKQRRKSRERKQEGKLDLPGRNSNKRTHSATTLARLTQIMQRKPKRQLNRKEETDLLLTPTIKDHLAQWQQHLQTYLMMGVLTEYHQSTFLAKKTIKPIQISGVETHDTSLCQQMSDMLLM